MFKTERILFIHHGTGIGGAPLCLLYLINNLNKQKLLLRFTDINFCVSQKMVDYYSTKHNISLDCFNLTRSSFDPDIFKDFSWSMKEKAKKRLGLETKIVFFYMGHKKAWQLAKEAVDLYANLKQYLNDSFIIFLTDDMENVKVALRDHRIPESEYMIKFVPHKEVSVYSYAADVEILIRDGSIVNKATSPVKFSEYLASGTLVFASASIGDLPGIVNKYGIGSVVREGSIDKVASFLNSVFTSNDHRKVIAEKCRKVAEEEFSVIRTIEVFRECYESIKKA